MLLALAALALPLHFEPNLGQAPADVLYLSPMEGVRLTRSALELGGVRMRFPRPAAALSPEQRLRGVSNYYAPHASRTGIPNYARVRYRNLFPGIDLSVYGIHGRLEYDWVVAPAADPAAIRFSLEGAGPLSIDSTGDLLAGPFRHRRPTLYQVIGGRRRTVAGRFVLHGGAAGFEVGPYDCGRPLVIDPVIVYSANFGGSGISINFPSVHSRYSDTGYAVALDRWSNAYVAGVTYSTDFPLRDPIQKRPETSCTVNCRFSAYFVARLDAAGDGLLYSTYIAAGTPQAGYTPPPFPGKPALAVDPDGNAFLAGAASAEELPLATPLPKQPGGGRDAFALKLTPTGAIAWSVLVGGQGADAAGGVALDKFGNVWLAGTTTSRDFPVTAGALRPTPSGASEAFLARIEYTGARLLYATYLGPAESASLALDASGSAYIAGTTRSSAFPATSGAVQPACGGRDCADGYIMKLDPGATRLAWATYLGGTGPETLNGIAVDAQGSVYVTGATESGDFPVTQGAMQGWKPAARSAWVAKLRPDGGALAYATYLGGSAREDGTAIAVDPSGNAYVTGATGWPDFPAFRAVQPGFATGTCPVFTPSGSFPTGYALCGGTGFLTVLSPSGSDLVYSTFLGVGEFAAGYGIALDAAGDAYVTGNGLHLAPRTPGSVGLVKIAPEGEPLAFRNDSITDAAAFRPGLPRPGGLATVFVTGLVVGGLVSAQDYPLPRQLAGVSIRVGGVAAPLLAVANAGGTGQINFQVPFEAAGNVVEVHYRGASAFAQPQPVGPGIFPGAILHARTQRAVTAADPAARGETIVVYCTGLGPVGSTVVTGFPAQSAAEATVRPTVTIGGLAAEVLYAGAAPGFAGLYQVNARVPEEAGAGDLPLVISSNLPGGLGPPPQSQVQSNTVTVQVH